MKKTILLAVSFFIILGLDWAAVPGNNFLFQDTIVHTGWICPIITLVAWIMFYSVLKYYSDRYGTSNWLKISMILTFISVLYYVIYSYIMLSVEFYRYGAFYAIYNNTFNMAGEISDPFISYRIIIKMLTELMCVIRWLVGIFSYISLVEIIRKYELRCIHKNYIVNIIICLIISFWQILVYIIDMNSSGAFDVFTVCYFILQLIFTVLIMSLSRKVNSIDI